MIPWKYCPRHDFKYLYANTCANCDGDNMQPIRIICDQDSIMADLCSDWFSEYNAKHGDDLVMDNVIRWETHEFTKSKNFDIYKVLETPGLFRKLKPLAGAVAALKAIYDAENKDGSKRFDLYAVSAAETDGALPEKKQWYAEHAPFLVKRRIGFFHDKHLIQTDVFIDDSPHNIKAMRAAQPLTQILTIAYPYNEAVADLTNLRAESWKDPLNAWKQIRDYLKV